MDDDAAVDDNDHRLATNNAVPLTTSSMREDAPCPGVPGGPAQGKA